MAHIILVLHYFQGGIESKGKYLLSMKMSTVPYLEFIIVPLRDG